MAAGALAEYWKTVAADAASLEEWKWCAAISGTVVTEETAEAARAAAQSLSARQVGARLGQSVPKQNIEIEKEYAT